MKCYQYINEQLVTLKGTFSHWCEINYKSPHTELFSTVQYRLTVLNLVLHVLKLLWVQVLIPWGWVSTNTRVLNTSRDSLLYNSGMWDTRYNCNWSHKDDTTFSISLSFKFAWSELISYNHIYVSSDSVNLPLNLSFLFTPANDTPPMK